MAFATDPDLPPPSLEEGESAGWLGGALRRLFPRVPPARDEASRERRDDDPDPPELPPTWFLT